jgi:acyl carrier protein
MTDQLIYTRLTEIFRDVLGNDSIILTPDLSAKDIEDWDSANHISLVAGAEVAFGVRFRTAELEELRNVGEFVELIHQKLGAD